MYRTDISRSTIDRENWKIKKRKISEGFVQAIGRTHVKIGAAFQQWRELKERERLESVALFLFDRQVMLILHCFTQLISVGFLLYPCVSSLLVSAIVVMPGLCTYVWGGGFKIGARSCWGMGVFVLVLSKYQHRLAKIA